MTTHSSVLAVQQRLQYMYSTLPVGAQVAKVPTGTTSCKSCYLARWMQRSKKCATNASARVQVLGCSVSLSVSLSPCASALLFLLRPLEMTRKRREGYRRRVTHDEGLSADAQPWQSTAHVLALPVPVVECRDPGSRRTLDLMRCSDSSQRLILI